MMFDWLFIVPPFTPSNKCFYKYIVPCLTARVKDVAGLRIIAYPACSCSLKGSAAVSCPQQSPCSVPLHRWALQSILYSRPDTRREAERPSCFPYLTLLSHFSEKQQRAARGLDVLPFGLSPALRANLARSDPRSGCRAGEVWAVLRQMDPGAVIPLLLCCSDGPDGRRQPPS